ncbi:MAG: hypothetical protein WC848_06815 [Parcubacteria group bacterium]|jgi:hypothetical protein
MEPKEKNTKEWYAWALRHHYYYNPIFFACAIKRGLDLAVLRNYLSCLENHTDSEKFSALLMKNHRFNTILIWIAHRNGFGMIDILQKYVDCLEAEMTKHAPEFPA